ncbi:hypothetical protein SNEBB_002969 [Seison nebaliae]|nr:hypothetical protein SNEBB_002969 [Seison nebaliae]
MSNCLLKKNNNTVLKRNIFSVPIVIEREGRGERAFDIFSRLLRDRIICLMSEVNDPVSSLIIAQMLFLQSENDNEPIHLYINSPGGSVTAGLAIYDTMQLVKPPIHTWCVGQACSMGSLLLTAGERNHRTALENSRVMIHQPSGGAQGQATDIEIQANEIKFLKQRLIDLYERHTGQDRRILELSMERDNYMTPTEAQQFGLIDHFSIELNRIIKILQM